MSASLAQLWWPLAEPATRLDYALDIGPALAAVADTAHSISLAVSPSGAGELIASGLTLIGTLVDVYLTGGQLGRVYLVKIVVTGVSGRVWEWVVQILINSDTSAINLPPPPAPVPGFGTPLVWTAT